MFKKIINHINAHKKSYSIGFIVLLFATTMLFSQTAVFDDITNDLTGSITDPGEEAAQTTGILQVYVNHENGSYRLKDAYDNPTEYSGSGKSEFSLPAGIYIIEFNEVKGYDTPKTQDFAIVSGRAITIKGEYKAAQTTGTLQVYVNHEDGSYRLKDSYGNPTEYSGSGSSEFSLPAGIYIIEFNEVKGYDTPKTQDFAIVSGRAITIKGEYKAAQTTGTSQVIVTDFPPAPEWTFEKSISINSQPLIADTNDIIKYKIIVYGGEIKNPRIIVGNVEYPFYNNGEYNDILPNDNVYGAQVGPLPEGTHSVTLVYEEDGKEIQQPQLPKPVIKPANLECKNLIETQGSINLVIVGVNIEDIRTEASKVIDIAGDNNGIFSVEPFKSNQDKFNVWYVDANTLLVPSGLNNFQTIEEFKIGYTLFTACKLENQYNILLYKDAETGYSQSQGRLGYSFVYYPITAAARILTHEFTHSFADLTDEYTRFNIIGESPNEEQCFFSPYVDCENTGGNQACQESVLSFSDCVLNARWANQIGDGCGTSGIIDCTEIDEAFNLEVSCYLGCGGKENLYRSTFSNIMHTLLAQPFAFGPVNEKLVCRKIKELAGSADGVCLSY